jgi:hypothetical protein
MFFNFLAHPKSEIWISDSNPTMSALRTEFHIQNSLNSIMSQIRSTNLNYSIKEMPFFTYITIRKSLNKAKRSGIHTEVELVSQSEGISNLLVHWKLLDQANDALKNMFGRELCTGEVETKAAGQVKALSEVKKVPFK